MPTYWAPVGYYVPSNHQLSPFSGHLLVILCPLIGLFGILRPFSSFTFSLSPYSKFLEHLIPLCNYNSLTHDKLSTLSGHLLVTHAHLLGPCGILRPL